MNKMKLSNWMAMQWLPRDMMAEKYQVGQDLTREQAAEVVRIIARSVGCNLSKRGTKKELNEIGNPYRDFVVCILLLMKAGGANHKWESMIWAAMGANLQAACKTVVLQNMPK